MNDKEYLTQSLKEIEDWEQEQLKVWFWDKLIDIPFNVLDKMTPQFIHNKLEILINEMSKYIEHGGNYLINPKSVYKKFPESYQIESMKEISDLPLEEMDAVSKKLMKFYSNFATVQGATTGFGGVWTLSADIPVLLGTTLKAIQEIAVTYGYDPTEEDERAFILKCLQFSYGSYTVKKALLPELHSFESSKNKTVAQLKGWKEVIYTFRDNFATKKFLQSFPFIGLFVGAYTNRKSLVDVTKTATMLYKKRRILERLNSFSNEKD